MATPLIGPDGKRYYLGDPAELEQALAAGYRQETAETPQTLGEQVKAGAGEALQATGAALEGAVRGAAPGAIGVALGGPQREWETPEDYQRRRFEAEQQLRRREEHPVAAFGGELAGMVASPLAKLQPGVAGAMGATTALGRIGTNIVGGGAAGALYGAGNTLDESGLGGTEVTAEKLLAGAGLGVLLGAGGGGIGQALEEGVRVAVPAIRKLAGGLPSLGDFAESRWLKASGALKGEIKKIPEDMRGEVAEQFRQKLGLGAPDAARDAIRVEADAAADKLLQGAGVGGVGLKPTMDAEAALEVVEKGLGASGKKMGAILEGADKAGARPSYFPILKRFDDIEAAANPAERELLLGGHMSPGPLTKARKYLGEMAALPVGSPKGGFAALNDLKSTLDNDINWLIEGKVAGGLKKDVVGIIRDEIDAQLAPQVGSALAKDFLDAKAAFGALASAKEALKRKTSTGADAIEAILERMGLAATPEARAFRVLGHADRLVTKGKEHEYLRWIQPSDHAIGAVGAMLKGGVGGALLGLPLAVAHKALREKGPALIAMLADRINGSPQLKLIASSFAAKMPTASPHLGQYAPMLAQAIAHSPAVGLATHMVHAQANPDYAERAQAAGFLPETPEEHSFASTKAQGLVGLAAALKTTDDKIDAGLDKVFKGGGVARGPDTTSHQDFGTKRMRREGLAAHKRRMDEVSELAANPEALLERVAGNLGAMGESAPGVSAAATAVAHRAAAYLAAQIQKPQKPGPLARDWVFNDSELFIFSKKLEAVERPLSVLEHAASGTLTKHQVAALQAVYPTVYAQIRDAALERMAAAKSVPYRQRGMLYLLTGVDPDGTFGQAVAKNQQAIAAGSSKPSEATTAPGESPLTLAKQYATPQQRREMDKA